MRTRRTTSRAGRPVFAIVPVWEAIAPASRSVATDEARKRVVHYEQDIILHRPIEAGMTLVSTATPTALLSAAERHVARHPHRDAHDGRRARQRAVRDRVLPRHRVRREPRRAPADHRLARTSRRRPARGDRLPGRRRSDRALRRGVRATTSRSTSTTSSRAGRPARPHRARPLHDGLHGACGLEVAGADPRPSDGSRRASRLRSFPATR